ncbi:hypothetical protein [Paenibacillus jilunlii]|uniref:Uncharacterized protein n=1 Tax=Paenibacillus jilunlii TaxID=682956 RepID=A0ABR5SUF5_9BACL|nr:hypothetical protein [Paenibacillus jilunlii]KWX74568.1 hypothetical protein AML91_15340 [Paenibacillus jilunlii]
MVSTGCRAAAAVSSFSPECISYTYGDLFPTMRYLDGKPYRGQVYTLKELREVISQFGWPQEWNAGWTQGPERYTRGSSVGETAAIFLKGSAKNVFHQ